MVVALIPETSLLQTARTDMQTVLGGAAFGGKFFTWHPGLKSQLGPLIPLNPPQPFEHTDPETSSHRIYSMLPGPLDQVQPLHLPAGETEVPRTDGKLCIHCRLKPSIAMTSRIQRHNPQPWTWSEHSL